MYTASGDAGSADSVVCGVWRALVGARLLENPGVARLARKSITARVEHALPVPAHHRAHRGRRCRGSGAEGTDTDMLCSSCLENSLSMSFSSTLSRCALCLYPEILCSTLKSKDRPSLSSLSGLVAADSFPS